MHHASTYRILGSRKSYPSLDSQHQLPSVLAGHSSRRAFNCNSRTIVCCSAPSDGKVPGSKPGRDSNSHKLVHDAPAPAARTGKAKGTPGSTPAAQGRPTSSSSSSSRWPGSSSSGSSSSRGSISGSGSSSSSRQEPRRSRSRSPGDSSSGSSNSSRGSGSSNKQEPRRARSSNVGVGGTTADLPAGDSAARVQHSAGAAAGAKESSRSSNGSHSDSKGIRGPGRKTGRGQRASHPTADHKQHDWQSRQQQPQRSRTTTGAASASGRPNLPPHVVQAMRRTKLIQSTKTPQQLLAVMQQDAGDINYINLGAAYTHADKLCCRGVPPQQQPAAVQQLLQHLHQLAEQLQQQCDTRTLSNIMWACGRLRYPATVKLLLLRFSQASQLQQANPQDVSNILWALATLMLTDTVVQQLVQQFVRVLPQASPQAVSNTLWAAATLEVQLAEGVAQQLVQQFIQVLPQAQPQNVSNTLWALATMNAQLAEGVVQQLVQQVARVLPQANPQNVSNILWAAATLNAQLSHGVTQQLVQQLIKVLPQASPQAVSLTLWAAATMNAQLTEGVAQQLVQQLVRVLPQASPQDVSNTLWAAATMNMQLSHGVTQQLVQQFIQVLPQANPQAVSLTLWAAATMNAQLVEGVVQQLVQQLVRVLPQAKPQNVSNTLWACGRMQYAPLQLLSALEQQTLITENLLAAAGPQALAKMAWACGQMGYRSKQLPGVMLQQAAQLQQESSRGSCSMQDLCNLCWSAAVLDLPQCLPQVLQLAAACQLGWATAAGEVCCQLYQVHMWLLDSQLPAPGQGLLGVLSQQQLQQCKDTWEQLLTESTTSAKASHLQRSVFAALQTLPGDTWQQTPVMEQRSADGVLSIDIAATTVSGVQLAIEVEGPNHFVQPNRTYDGSTLFRNRALAVRGYVLVSIPFWEWGVLRGAEQKQQYLLSKLQAPVKQAAAAGSSLAHVPLHKP